MFGFLQSIRGLLDARRLEDAAVGAGMPGCRADPFVPMADDGDDIRRAANGRPARSSRRMRLNRAHRRNATRQNRREWNGLRNPNPAAPKSSVRAPKGLASSAATAAIVSAANADADEAMPAPMGKLLRESTWARSFVPSRRRSPSRCACTRCSAATVEASPLIVKLSASRFRRPAHSGRAMQRRQVHAERAVGWQPQLMVAIAPILDECYVGMRARACYIVFNGHRLRLLLW